MTDPGASKDVPRVERYYSKDYWDIVFHQLSRHRLFKVGMVVLALFYAIAIYAPFLANDRPYVIEGVDYTEYNDSLRQLRPIALSLGTFAAMTDEQYLAERLDAAPETRVAAIEVERAAARTRLDTLRRYLPDDREEHLDDYVAKVEEASRLAKSGDADGAIAAAAAAKDLATALRKEIAPRAPGAEGAAAESGIPLVAVRSHPLIENLGPIEVFFMVMWLFVLSWPLWNRFANRVLLRGDRERVRNWRRKKALIVLATSLGAALLWIPINGVPKSSFDAALFKDRLTTGAFVTTSTPVFAPLAFGYSELHMEEPFRPPTWTAASIVDDDGRLVGRAGSADNPSSPVIVRFGEPDKNEWTRHIGGTDLLGRDFLVRMIWGGRVSLAVGILSAILLTVIGVVVGSVAGYFGGWIDIAIMRMIEIIQSIPAFFLILATMSFTDPKVVEPMFAIIVVIALIRWTGVARLVRGEFMRLRDQEFVVAARALGFSSARTIFKHVLPNALSPVLVAAAFAVASGILTESAVSYLGFGIQKPKASWGSLVNESQVPAHWWVQVFPGVLIFVTVTCYNLVGDAIRDALDPKMKV